MTAEQAEVVGQDVTVERLTELCTQRATTNPTGQAAEDGAGDRAESDTDRAGERADSCASLTTGERGTDAARDTTDGADGRTDFHGLVEGSDFG